MNIFYRKTIKLSEREYALLQYLASSKRPTVPAIALSLGISEGNCRVVLFRLKTKTGLVNHLGKSDCLAVLAECETAVQSLATPVRALPGLTTMQTTALAGLARGMHYAAICVQMGISHTAAKNHANQGRKKLGLENVHGDALRAELAKYFPPASVTMDDPAFN